ncbi:MAG: hypothetical protein ACHQAQ_05700 [Hyphomicrobiales bacterium]
MSPKDVMAILTKLVKNPYHDIYEKMPEYELASWKYVFEASIAMGARNREKVLRLRAINRTLKGIKVEKLSRQKASHPEVSHAA